MPLIKAGLKHKGFAMIDVISPCVTFNDHEGSTKSYEFTREHYDEAVHADFVPPRQEITASYARGRGAAGADARRQPHPAAQARPGLRPDPSRQGVRIPAHEAARGRARHRPDLRVAERPPDMHDDEQDHATCR